MDIETMNERFAIVTIGGKVRVWDGKNFLTMGDFRLLLMNEVKWTEDQKPTPWSSIWLTAEERRQYDGIVFDPSQDSGCQMLNLYEGLSVEPTENGKWSLFQDHIHENVCGGRTDYYSWLTNWMAHIVQHPENKIGTAIVIRGGKGTGKSLYAETFGKLFGRHFITLNNGDHVTNRFNDVYEQSLLVCADEAVWAGDKKSEGTLKNLITAKNIFIERKGLGGYDSKNYTNFIFTTNYDWAVPASDDERRFFVLDIGTGWQKNDRMFGAMIQQMTNGGYGRMLYDLLKVDIGENLRDPPKTQGLIDQKEFSEPIAVQFWREFVMEFDRDEWPVDVLKDTLYLQFVDFCRLRGVRHVPGKGPFFKQIRKYIQPWEEIKKVDTPNTGRKRFIVLPNLETCKELLK